jgi:hypothetical protein
LLVRLIVNNCLSTQNLEQKFVIKEFVMHLCSTDVTLCKPIKCMFSKSPKYYMNSVALLISVYAFSYHVALPQKENPLCLYHPLLPSKTRRYCTAVLPAVAHSTEVRSETDDRPTTTALEGFQCTHKTRRPWALLDASLYSTNSHQSLVAGMHIIVRPNLFVVYLCS